MQHQYQCSNCGAPVAFGMRFCGNCGLQLNWPTQQQTQPPPNYQQQGIVEAETEKPKKATNPVLEGFKWIGCLFFTLLFVGSLYMFIGTTGNLLVDLGRIGGAILGVLLVGWFISWLTKKRNKGDS